MRIAVRRGAPNMAARSKWEDLKPLSSRSRSTARPPPGSRSFPATRADCSRPRWPSWTARGESMRACSSATAPPSPPGPRRLGGGGIGVLHSTTGRPRTAEIDELRIQRVLAVGGGTAVALSAGESLSYRSLPVPGESVEELTYAVHDTMRNLEAQLAQELADRGGSCSSRAPGGDAAGPPAHRGLHQGAPPPLSRSRRGGRAGATRLRRAHSAVLFRRAKTSLFLVPEAVRARRG